ncbi:Uncharacterised protein [Salmonella enterica subsp. houtenae]|nr:Uncharacterised protein [Salmonella enterica subsp. houtenae]
MALIWRDVFDPTVFMFNVVPVCEVADPCPCVIYCVKAVLGKPFSGHQGQYLSVRNNDSEYGLSLLTRGRE